MKKAFFVLLFFITIRLSAQTEMKTEALKSLLETDKAFSKMSEEKGKETAFLTFSADDGILLRIKSDPILGKEHISEYIKRIASVEKPEGVLTWDPLNAFVSESADLGYTYGTYRIVSKSTDGKSRTQYGTYVTIWKKQTDGTWKFQLDSSNPGLTTETK